MSSLHDFAANTLTGAEQPLDQYGVSFPMFARVDVNGADAHPVWRWLKGQQGGVLGSTITWNFTKFVVGRDGQVIDRYGPRTTPAAIEADVERALAA